MWEEALWGFGIIEKPSAEEDSKSAVGFDATGTGKGALDDPLSLIYGKLEAAALGLPIPGHESSTPGAPPLNASVSLRDQIDLIKDGSHDGSTIGDGSHDGEKVYNNLVTTMPGVAMKMPNAEILTPRSSRAGAISGIGSEWGGATEVGDRLVYNLIGEQIQPKVGRAFHEEALYKAVEHYVDRVETVAMVKPEVEE